MRLCENVCFCLPASVPLSLSEHECMGEDNRLEKVHHRRRSEDMFLSKPAIKSTHTHFSSSPHQIVFAVADAPKQMPIWIFRYEHGSAAASFALNENCSQFIETSEVWRSTRLSVRVSVRRCVFPICVLSPYSPPTLIFSLQQNDSLTHSPSVQSQTICSALHIIVSACVERSPLPLPPQ